MAIGFAVLASILGGCGRGKVPTVGACPAAPFVLSSSPRTLTPVAVPVSPTFAATSGAYRDLKIGASMVVAAGAKNSQIVLARGVSNDDFAVSLYAHGPVPLQPITVLGQTTSLYPGVDLLGADRNLVGRVPFAAGPDRVSNACSRWELRARGPTLTVSSLAAYAGAIKVEGGPNSATTTTSTTVTATTPPTSVPAALQTHNPKVEVNPSTNVTNGEVVQISVTGFGSGGKFFLSECASADDANSAGCGQQLAAQPFGVTDSSGAGSYQFTVTSIAPTSPYNTSSTLPCTNQCVIVVTVGIGYGYGYAPITFAG